jgi:hypothetical protein
MRVLTVGKVVINPVLRAYGPASRKSFLLLFFKTEALA